MQPVALTVPSLNVTAPVVTPAVPPTNVVYVTHDHVPPSFSNLALNNNTKGNSAPPPPAEEETVSAQSGGKSAIASPAFPSSLSATAQATFLAQLAAQDGSPEAQVILVQYQKLVEFSNVKYKPSNAFKPAAEPAGVFGRILMQERMRVELPEPRNDNAPEPQQSAAADIVSATPSASVEPVARAAPAAGAQKALRIYAANIASINADAIQQPEAELA